jgi:hypothetical protein
MIEKQKDLLASENPSFMQAAHPHHAAAVRYLLPVGWLAVLVVALALR